jgi:hypothetical protein
MIDLYCTDDDFRILCGDYLTTVDTLEESRMKSINNQTIENAFLQLSLDLEKEILHLMKRRKNKGL